MSTCRIVTDENKKVSITCLTCNNTSHNKNDVEGLYCGYCKVFHDNVVHQRTEIVSSSKLHPEYDTVTPGTRLKCAFEVIAGLFPGHVIPELSRRWLITSENWHAEGEMTDEQFKAARPDGKSTFITFRDAAHEYAKSITNPQICNHVRVDFIWF